MRAAAAEIKTADRRQVARPVEHGTHREQLIESQLAMIDVAAGHAVNRFEVLWRDDLHALNEAWEIRSVSRKCLHDKIAQFPAANRPVALFQLIGRKLRVNGHDML